MQLTLNAPTQQNAKPLLHFISPPPTPRLSLYASRHHHHHHHSPMKSLLHSPLVPNYYSSSSSSSSSSGPCHLRMDYNYSCSSSSSLKTESHGRLPSDKVVVIMGATGCGKSRLSLDLSTTCGFETEIINSDKMQVYKGLDITTNKISAAEQRGVPHHLLGDLDPAEGEFTASRFRIAGGAAISDISSRGKLPVVVGGSNSFIHALLAHTYCHHQDAAAGIGNGNGNGNGIPFSFSSHLRYNCCFLWLDVSFPVLCDYLCRRVDQMMDSGMLEELAKFYEETSQTSSTSKTGLLKAIGVPEMERYFQLLNNNNNFNSSSSDDDDDAFALRRRSVYEEAVREIKENTCRLAGRQMGKILRLKTRGWDLHRLDATEAFREVMRGGAEADDEEEEEEMEEEMVTAGGQGKTKMLRRRRRTRWVELWEREVVEPSVKIVKRFLEE